MLYVPEPSPLIVCTSRVLFPVLRIVTAFPPRIFRDNLAFGLSLGLLFGLALVLISTILRIRSRPNWCFTVVNVNSRIQVLRTAFIFIFRIQYEKGTVYFELHCDAEARLPEATRKKSNCNYFCPTPAATPTRPSNNHAFYANRSPNTPITPVNTRITARNRASETNQHPYTSRNSGNSPQNPIEL